MDAIAALTDRILEATDCEFPPSMGIETLERNVPIYGLGTHYLGGMAVLVTIPDTGNRQTVRWQILE